MRRFRILAALQQRVPSPYVAVADASHKNRVLVVDPTDPAPEYDGARWIAQVFQAVPMPNGTRWRHPEKILDMTAPQAWIVCYEDDFEYTGFEDEGELAEWVATRLRTRPAGPRLPEPEAATQAEDEELPAWHRRYRGRPQWAAGDRGR